MMRTSEDSDEEIESLESTNGADPGKVMTMHGDEPVEVMLTHPTALSFSCPHIHMLEQGAESAVTVPPGPPEVRSVHSQPQGPKLSMLPPGTT